MKKNLSVNDLIDLMIKTSKDTATVKKHGKGISVEYGKVDYKLCWSVLKDTIENSILLDVDTKAQLGFWMDSIVRFEEDTN